MSGKVCVIVSAVIFLGIASITAKSTLNIDPEPSDLVVKTTTGFVQGGNGGVTEGQQKPIYSFRSIPFAEPPVGELRFEPPVPKNPWDGVLDVSEKGAECLQGSDPVRGSEDCLFLKVYTTEGDDKNGDLIKSRNIFREFDQFTEDVKITTLWGDFPKEKNQKKLPVMVWVYGGDFFAGAPDFDEHNPDYLLDEGVIVVSFHYRVGIFGFLSTGDLTAPGNAGLKDQVLALKWIKENIESFGGDPENITIFGQSAGGASIAYLLQTEQTKGLYARAIMQSGSSLSLWALNRVAPDMAKRVANDLELETGSSEVIVKGLKSVDGELLQSTSSSAMTFGLIISDPTNGLLFSPVIEPEHDGAVVTGYSHQQLLEGKFNHVPMIVGYNSLEGLLNSIPATLGRWLLSFEDNIGRLVPVDMNISSDLNPYFAGTEIKYNYFGGISSMLSASRVNLMRYISDDQFERPIQKAIRLYSPHNPVYFYTFSYEGALGGVTDRTTSGVGHTEELGYIWNFKYNGSAEDYQTRNRMVKLWTNFVKTANPTPEQDPLLQNVIWPATGPDNLVCLDVNKNLTIVQNPNEDGIKFWDKLFEDNGTPPFDTF